MSMRDDTVASYGEVRSGLSTEWADWLQTIGVTPVAIPNGAADVPGALTRVNPDIVILTGGNNVVAGDDAGRVSERRNRTETEMVDWALAAGKPVVGFCRGLQFLNGYFGGGIRTELPGPSKSHVAKVHNVRLDGFLRDLAGTEEVDVNSFHDQGVLAGDVAEGFEVCALSEDGVVEGIRHLTAPIAALQWHPERNQGMPELCGRLIHSILEPNKWEVSA